MKLHFDNKEIQEIDGEFFRSFPEVPHYLVSNFGRIKSPKQIVRHNFGGDAIKKERILTQTDNGSGYLSVGLTISGRTKTIRVSRIVALTFIENPENKPQVNHKNGVKYDNNIENLEWSTSGENVMHAWNTGLARKQNSFVYVRERLKHINSYMVYEPRVSTPVGTGTIYIDQTCYKIRYDNGKIENVVKSLRFWKDDFKLILRNLSSLTQEIEPGVIGLVDFLKPEINLTGQKIERIGNMFYARDAFGNAPVIHFHESTSLPFPKWQWLLKHHFNIFNLDESEFIAI